MKVTKQEHDDLIASNNKDTLGFAVQMKSGNSEGDGQQVTSYYIVDKGSVDEIGLMTGEMIAILKVHGYVTEQEAGAFRVMWRKIIKR